MPTPAPPQQLAVMEVPALGRQHVQTFHTVAVGDSVTLHLVTCEVTVGGKLARDRYGTLH